jgi:hypothetical protein
MPHLRGIPGKEYLVTRNMQPETSTPSAGIMFNVDQSAVARKHDENALNGMQSHRLNGKVAGALRQRRD